MNNLKTLVENQTVKPYRIADVAKIARNTLYTYIADDDLPDAATLGKLRCVAAVLGQRVIVTFEPINNDAIQS
jgi:hypothetical protein